ncbi:MAG: HDOD domain-containing protein [Gammaproteobacteria bacterium]|nr:HDOD domain-containing protein [Gammaproteobacteria bacterium]
MVVDLNELRLPALSEAGLQVLELLASDDIDFAYLGDFLAKDPLLSATMLKYANSPIYKREVQISNVRTAVSILGLKRSKMAVSFAIMKSCDKPSFSATEKIWSHSINISTISRVIAEDLFPNLADDIETSALMHDMGALILARTYPEQYQKVFEVVTKTGTALDEAERAEFELSHDELFHVVAGHLRLSNLTLNVVEGMHSHDAITDVVDPVEKHRIVIYLAHYFLEKYDSVSNFKENIPNDMDSMSLLLNLSDDKVDQLYDQCEIVLDVL